MHLSTKALHGEYVIFFSNIIRQYALVKAGKFLNALISNLMSIAPFFCVSSDRDVSDRDV